MYGASEFEQVFGENYGILMLESIVLLMIGSQATGEPKPMVQRPFPSHCGVCWVSIENVISRALELAICLFSDELNMQSLIARSFFLFLSASLEPPPGRLRTPCWSGVVGSADVVSL